MTEKELEMFKSLKTQNIVLLFVSNIGSIAFLIASVIILLNGNKFWWIFLIFSVLFHATIQDEKKQTETDSKE